MTLYEILANSYLNKRVKLTTRGQKVIYCEGTVTKVDFRFNHFSFDIQPVDGSAKPTKFIIDPTRTEIEIVTEQNCDA